MGRSKKDRRLEEILQQVFPGRRPSAQRARAKHYLQAAFSLPLAGRRDFRDAMLTVPSLFPYADAFLAQQVRTILADPELGEAAVAFPTVPGREELVEELARNMAFHAKLARDLPEDSKFMAETNLAEKVLSSDYFIHAMMEFTHGQQLDLFPDSLPWRAAARRLALLDRDHFSLGFFLKDRYQDTFFERAHVSPYHVLLTDDIGRTWFHQSRKRAAEDRLYKRYAKTFTALATDIARDTLATWTFAKIDDAEEDALRSTGKRLQYARRLIKQLRPTGPAQEMGVLEFALASDKRPSWELSFGYQRPEIMLERLMQRDRDPNSTKAVVAGIIMGQITNPSRSIRSFIEKQHTARDLSGSGAQLEFDHEDWNRYPKPLLAKQMGLVGEDDADWLINEFDQFIDWLPSQYPGLYTIASIGQRWEESITNELTLRALPKLGMYTRSPLSRAFEHYRHKYNAYHINPIRPYSVAAFVRPAVSALTVYCKFAWRKGKGWAVDGKDNADWRGFRDLTQKLVDVPVDGISPLLVWSIWPENNFNEDPAEDFDELLGLIRRMHVKGIPLEAREWLLHVGRKGNLPLLHRMLETTSDVDVLTTRCGLTSSHAITGYLGSGRHSHAYTVKRGSKGDQRAVLKSYPSFVEGTDEAFSNEVSALTRLRGHVLENVVQIYDSGGHLAEWLGESVPAVLMEHVNGPTLTERVLNAENGPGLSEGETLRYSVHLLSALYQLENVYGLYHNDLTSNNARIDRETDTVKLLDFGDAAPMPARSRGGRTQSRKGRQSSSAFSLGLLAYFMRTGRSLFGDKAALSSTTHTAAIESSKDALYERGRLAPAFEVDVARCGEHLAPFIEACLQPRASIVGVRDFFVGHELPGYDHIMTRDELLRENATLRAQARARS